MGVYLLMSEEELQTLDDMRDVHNKTNHLKLSRQKFLLYLLKEYAANVEENSDSIHRH